MTQNHKDKILQQLKALAAPEFEELISMLQIDPSILSPPTTAQATRAIELLRCTNSQEKVDDIEPHLKKLQKRSGSSKIAILSATADNSSLRTSKTQDVAALSISSGIGILCLSNTGLLLICITLIIMLCLLLLLVIYWLDSRSKTRSN